MTSLIVEMNNYAIKGVELLVLPSLGMECCVVFICLSVVELATSRYLRLCVVTRIVEHTSNITNTTNTIPHSREVIYLKPHLDHAIK